MSAERTISSEEDRPAREAISDNIANKFPWTLELALSGGGFRASAFSLGALLYLVHSGLNTKVKNIASVSGGSIPNAFFGCQCGYDAVDLAVFRELAGRLTKAIARKGLLQRWQAWAWIVALTLTAILAFLAAALFLGAVGYTLTEGPQPQNAFVKTAGLSIVSVLLFLIVFLILQYRSWPVGSLIRSLIPPDQSLRDLARCKVHHVFCATDLTFGRPFFLSSADGGRIFSEVYGIADGSKINLVKAVRASAAFPPLIPPIAVSPNSDWKYLQGGGLQTNDVPREVWLTDGGAFNNFGTDWHARRRELFLVENIHSENPEPSSDWQNQRYGQVQLVIDAGLPPTGKKQRLLRLPVIGFFAYASRLIDLMYNSTLAGRSDASEQIAISRIRSFPRKWLARHESASLTKRLFRSRPESYDPNDDFDAVEHGALKLFISYSRAFDDARKIWTLSDTVGEQFQLVSDWISENNKSAVAMPRLWPWTGEMQPVRPQQDIVGTTFFRLGDEPTLRLIVEGYLKTREVLFYALGFVGPAIPNEQWFRQLLNDEN